MSKDIIVLTPNARRVTVHCSPDTSILQVLEDVCKKHSYEAADYDLKHHNKILDLSTTIRFSNLPNRACLEMVATKRERNESNVTVGLQLEDGERRLGEFTPSTSLLDVITSLAAPELEKIKHPTILYTRQEIFGVEALKQKTLRHLGLLGGRAILRLLNKSEDEIKTQANVSSVYRSRPQLPETPSQSSDVESAPKADVSHSQNIPSTSNPVHLIKKCKAEAKPVEDELNTIEDNVVKAEESKKPEEIKSMEMDKQSVDSSSDTSLLERRLNIENEVTFIGPQKAIAFIQCDSPEQLEDLPDEFYDLTVEEVRKLYHTLHSKRIELENAPLLTSRLIIKEIDEEAEYNHAVVRVQFPDNVILQGVFRPSDTATNVRDFVSHFLEQPHPEFSLFVPAARGSIPDEATLQAAGLVPAALLHVRWETAAGRLLDTVTRRLTPADVADILASKYRSPSRRKADSSTKEQPPTSSSSGTKLPKWFKK